MTSHRRLGLLGGTFDPIHFGHLDAADAAREALALDEVVFLPSHVPPHRSQQPRASAFHRFALLALALSDHDGYRACDMELNRQGPSFTIDTLRALHEQGWTAAQIFFILGADAFADISSWREYPAVVDAAHFVVMARPGCHIDDALARSPELAHRVGPAPVRGIDPENTGIFLVHARTRDVSSTEVRRRLATGESVAGLVPDSVARYVMSHRLYQGVSELHG